MKYLLLLISGFLFSSSLFAGDIAREKRLADEIIDTIIDGEAVYLKSNSHDFLSIYMESDNTEARGAAIILHGRGYHPDWKDVAHPLRVGLPEHGWHTLSVQMPVLDKQAKYYDYVPIFPEAFPRIEAAIKFLKDKGINNIILIAHSCSVHMSMAWFEYTRSEDIKAFVGVSMGATDYQQPMRKTFPFEQLAIPVLDIYGDHDYPAVIKNATARLSQIKQAGNKKSAQRLVKSADHYFTDKGNILLEEITQWLKTL